MAQKTVIIIGGPTAVGKTTVAIAVAKHFGTEIISADSRQCYRELKIGVARPSDAEQAAVPHYFIASHSVADNITAATFEQYALEMAADIFKHNDVAIMVGGTGLYIQAFCEGFDAIPDVPETIRQKVRTSFSEHGIAWLQNEVALKDPAFFERGEIQNPQRLMRALEVFESTGQSILKFRQGAKKERPFNVMKIGLELEKEQLHQRINQRVDIMMQGGLLEEVQSLLSFRHHNSLQTVGYRELFAYLDGNITLAKAIDAIKQNTRQYAKRQLTWFRKDKEYQWFAPRDFDQILIHIENSLQNVEQ